MVLDRRKPHEIVHALLRAKNRKGGFDVLANASQNSAAPGDGSYGEPVFPSASQQGFNAGYRTEYKPTGQYPVSKAFDPNQYPATDAARARTIELATQKSLGGAGTHKNPSEHRAPILRLADVEPHMAKEASHREKKMPEVRYVTAGEIWSEFLGGIGKGIAQAVSDIGVSGAKARRSVFGGVYVDPRNPDLFGPPTSPWEDTGRKIVPGIMVAIRPFPLGEPKTWRGKIIGKVEPPKHLKPGTVLFGNYMHEKIAEFLEASYSKTKFLSRVKPGLQGVDMEYKRDLDPGFKYLDIKTNKPHSQKQLNSQIQNWGYDESTVRAFSYDEQGNIYDGFGE